MPKTETHRLTPEQVVDLACKTVDEFIDSPGIGELLMDTMLEMLSKSLSSYHTEKGLPEDLVVIWMAATIEEMRQFVTQNGQEEATMH